MGLTALYNSFLEPVGFTDNLSEWAHQVNRFHDELGVDSSKVLEYEASMFAREMMNVTPPKDKHKTLEKIESSIKAKFESLANPKRDAKGLGLGKDDVYWYAFGDTSIFGVANEQDKRDASVEDLYRLLPTIRGGGGKVRVGQRGKQAVYITRKILTKAATVRALIQRVKTHLGRLASGWYPSWVRTGRHGRDVPQRIARHAPTSDRVGFYEDGLNLPSPEFTLINGAKGAENISEWLMSGVLNYRAHSMATKIERIHAWRVAHPGEAAVLPGDLIASPAFDMDSMGTEDEGDE